MNLDLPEGAHVQIIIAPAAHRRPAPCNLSSPADRQCCRGHGTAF